LIWEDVASTHNAFAVCTCHPPGERLWLMISPVNKQLILAAYLSTAECGKFTGCQVDHCPFG